MKPKRCENEPAGQVGGRWGAAAEMASGKMITYSDCVTMAFPESVRILIPSFAPLPNKIVVTRDCRPLFSLLSVE